MVIPDQFGNMAVGRESASGQKPPVVAKPGGNRNSHISAATVAFRIIDFEAYGSDSERSSNKTHASPALSYWASAIFGRDDCGCALTAEGRLDGDAGSGDERAASGGALWDGRWAACAGSTITFAPTFTRS